MSSHLSLSSSFFLSFMSRWTTFRTCSASSSVSPDRSSLRPMVSGLATTPVKAGRRRRRRRGAGTTALGAEVGKTLEMGIHFKNWIFAQNYTNAAPIYYGNSRTDSKILVLKSVLLLILLFVQKRVIAFLSNHKTTIKKNIITGIIPSKIQKRSEVKELWTFVEEHLYQFQIFQQHKTVLMPSTKFQNKSPQVSQQQKCKRWTLFIQKAQLCHHKSVNILPFTN